MTDTRPCTCAPDERPYPCQHQYALGLCRKAEIRSLRIELDRCIAQIADLTKIRLEDELVHGNIMGRIAIALFGDQNNRTDEECVARAAEIGYELSGAKQRAERAESELAAARAECLRRQTIIGEVALERDAARALLREVNARTQGTIAEYEEYLTRIDAALAAPGEGK